MSAPLNLPEETLRAYEQYILEDDLKTVETSLGMFKQYHSDPDRLRLEWLHLLKTDGVKAFNYDGKDKAIIAKTKELKERFENYVKQAQYDSKTMGVNLRYLFLQWDAATNDEKRDEILTNILKHFSNHTRWTSHTVPTNLKKIQKQED